MPYCRIYLVIIVFYLTSCAVIQPKTDLPSVNTSAHQLHLAALNNIKSFALKGRLGVVTQQKGFSGSINWQHESETDDIDIYSPLGGKVADIAKNSAGVTLISQDGKRFKALDAESLTENILGFRLPLNGLSNWVLGKPGISKVDALSTNEMGRLITLKQDGWDISYENYMEINSIELPTKILLKSEKVNLKIIIEKWISL